MASVTCADGGFGWLSSRSRGGRAIYSSHFPQGVACAERWDGVDHARTALVMTSSEEMMK
jgi:hypothetical protein